MSDNITLLKVDVDVNDFLKFAQGGQFDPDVSLVGYEGLNESEQEALQTKIGEVISLCMTGRLREVLNGTGGDEE
jgi:hypothetical protein